MFARPSFSILFPYTTLFRSPTDDLPHQLRISEEGGHGAVRLQLGQPDASVGRLEQIDADVGQVEPGMDELDQVVDRGVEDGPRSEEHTSELQSHSDLVCRLL